MWRTLIRPQRLGLMLVAGIFVALSVWAGGRLARADAEAELRQQAGATLALDLALLDSELQRHRATPVILATEEPLRTLLQRPNDAARAVVNARLEALALQTGAAAIYVVDRNGTALAASNYRGPASFVGADYAFRPYFRDAMRQGQAEFFGQGTVSREPGLYISRRIDGPRGPLGVVVAKVQFQAVESAWARQGGEVVAADRHGVILLASNPARRFSTLTPLPTLLRQRLMQSRQFGEAPLTWTGASLSPPDRLRIGEARLRVSQAEVGTTGWRLQVWTPMDAVDARAAVGRWLGLLGSVLVLLIAAALRAALLRSQRRVEAESDARRVLEEKVGQRTQALTEANDRLSREVTERREAEKRLRRLQADLVQANRLAQMGQTMAGVAHEINQPVAAIRANADNALTLLDRREEAEARANLVRIQSLTGRIGGVIEGLRGLARKSSRSLGPVQVSDAIEGAVLLLASRDRAGALSVTGEVDARVMADRLRLEQVLINLLQNAFEAVEGRSDPAVALSVEPDGDHVRLVVADNGPGVPDALRAALFTPFTTGKPDGLGLGLVISRDIMESFGGDLALDDDHRGPGARFLVTLQRAAP
jgi:two-component system C4-dicarboxylate transport sensor histidine kinase DctB